MDNKITENAAELSASKVVGLADELLEMSAGMETFGEDIAEEICVSRLSAAAAELRGIAKKL